MFLVKIDGCAGSSPRACRVACCGARCCPKVVVISLQRLAYKMRNEVHRWPCGSPGGRGGSRDGLLFARLPHTPMVNLFRRRPYLWSSRDSRMTSFRPTKIQQFAIEAKLNLMFGANVYDRIFLGFEVLEVVDGELRGWAPTEHGAAVIDGYYASKLAWIAETVFKQPIRRVSD